jgi:dihydroflavonol-4-reductase
MKALITGANGLIGANLARALLGRGHQVRGLVRESSDLRGLGALAAGDVELRRGDVRDAAAVADAARGCDVVFHTAAVFSYWGHSAGSLREIAVEGTRAVLDAAAAAGVARVVLTSSSVTCGSSTKLAPRTEAQHLDDPDPPPYFVAKAEQERFALARAAELGLELVCVLPTMTVGPHDVRLGPSNALIVNYLLDPLKLTYPGGINVVSVRDVADGHILAAERGAAGERYLLAGENLEYSLLYRHVAELCGVPAPRAYAGHAASYLSSAALELLSAITGKPPALTREQARTLGRFYWYRHERAAALGYAPMGARRALAEAIGWLVLSPHVSAAVRRTLRLAPEVYEARAADLPAYRRGA